jgi:hypothetical protein
MREREIAIVKSIVHSYIIAIKTTKSKIHGRRNTKSGVYQFLDEFAFVFYAWQFRG